VSSVADTSTYSWHHLFTFTRLPPSQCRSARTTNAIRASPEEFKRRIKTQTVLPSADPAAMLYWALLALVKSTMRKVDGLADLAATPTCDHRLTSPPDSGTLEMPEIASNKFNTIRDSTSRLPPDNVGPQFAYGTAVAFVTPRPPRLSASLTSFLETPQPPS